MEENNVNINLLKENLEIILSLEYYGIHIEDIKEQDLKQLYFFSVPEKSTLKTNYDNLNDLIKEKDGLIKLAKDVLSAANVNSCRAVFGDEEDEEFYDDIRNNIFDYVSFFAKVRYGEIWNKEMGDAAIMRAIDEIKNNTYKLI